MRKLIGRGTFTKAYQVSETEVEVVTTCPAKECYHMFSQGNPLAPVIDLKDRLDSGESVYSMPLYPKVKAPKKQLNSKAYATYQALRKLDRMPILSHSAFCVEVGQILTLDEETKENIISLADDVCNAIDCHKLRFEISPRNISHDANGNLVMLDCFFDVELLRKTRGW